MRVLFVLAFLLALNPLSVSPSGAQTAQSQKAPGFNREQTRLKMNESLLILMSGPLGATYLQLANDISVVVNEGGNVRVIPAATPGAQTNIGDILFLRGVDLGITTIQMLNALKASGEFGPNLDKQIAYIAPLAVDTFQVLVRPEINSLQDLKGKKASFNVKGSGTSKFGPTVLKTLGLELAEVNVAPGDAIQLMRNGEIDATVCSCPIPVPTFPTVKPDSGFKFLEVPYVPALEQDYVPASLTSAHYPNLIAEGQKIQTIATSTVLISFNWAPGTERYQRIEKFVNALFSNVDKLREPPRHPLWRSVNMAANIKGWQRFPAAQQWLDRKAAEEVAKAPPSGIDATLARAQAGRAAPGNPAEQERLFREFLEWSRQKKR